MEREAPEEIHEARARAGREDGLEVRRSWDRSGGLLNRQTPRRRKGTSGRLEGLRHGYDRQKDSGSTSRQLRASTI